MKNERDCPRRRKAEELASAIRHALLARGMAVDEAFALGIVAHLAVITPPEVETFCHLLTIREGGVGGGQSVKPGNIVLNMRKFVTAVASGVLTTVGVVEVPWTAIFGALVVWDSLYAGATAELSEAEASVVWTLWCLCDEGHTVADDGLLEAVNAERQKHGRPALTHRELQDALRKLERIGSIERSSENGSRWWLREWVRVSCQ